MRTEYYIFKNKLNYDKSMHNGRASYISDLQMEAPDMHRFHEHIPVALKERE